MPHNLRTLLDQGRFEECRLQAMQVLGQDGQTTNVQAECHYAIFRCDSEAGELISAAQRGERALHLAQVSEAVDLSGMILFDLSLTYARLRRYRQLVRTMTRWLELEPQLKSSPVQQGRVRHRLAWAHLCLSEYTEALIQTEQVRVLALQAGNQRLAECSRRLHRRILLRANSLDEVPHLIEASRQYFSAHPDDTKSHFYLWYDLADLTAARGSPPAAVAHALRALELASGNTQHEVDCYLLLYRIAAAQSDWQDALAFALNARLSALSGDRLDLAHEALILLDELLCAHGPSLLDGIQRHFVRSGVNPLEFFPAHVSPPDWTIERPKEVYGVVGA